MEKVKVAAVQMNLVQCTSEKDFFEVLDKLVYESAQNGAKIVSFPEDLGFCVAWAKESFRINNIMFGIEPEFNSLTFKNKIEQFANWIVSKLNLKFMGEWLSQKRISDIIKRVFKKLAKKHGVVIISGTVYERKIDGIYNTCYVFDYDGKLAGSYDKHKLVPLEIAWGVKPGFKPYPIYTKDYDIGVVICYDLDDTNWINEIVRNGAQMIFAPSGGWRPYPDYPFDAERESPQLKRSVENKISIVKPYCCGWLFPGLYFQGHTQIVDMNGEILAESVDWGQEKIFYAEIPLKKKLY